jgi:catechol 2,3-dioxygenase-like lactoylglutathione lyase family enzyme
MIDGYTGVAVVVSDAQASKKWYVEKLGFKTVLDRGHVVCVSPDAKEPSIVLHLCGDGLFPLEPGNTGIGLTADDVERTCVELSSKGVRFSAKPEGAPGSKSARFLDPDGNEFWLFESRVAKKVYEDQMAKEARARRTQAAGGPPSEGKLV